LNVPCISEKEPQQPPLVLLNDRFKGDRVPLLQPEHQVIVVAHQCRSALQSMSLPAAHLTEYSFNL
jgi:hypothetical protein